MTYPLHLGVTEAGDAEDGRIKSAVGIGALLAEGIGDTIRVSLSEPPENEIPVAITLRDHIASREGHPHIQEPSNVLPGASRDRLRKVKGFEDRIVSMHADSPDDIFFLADAGPLTIHPMTPILSPFISRVASFTSFNVFCRSKSVRPQLGQAIYSVFDIRRRVACRMPNSRYGHSGT